MNTELKEKIESAKKLLSSVSLQDGQYLSVNFSGGRDSCVLKHMILALNIPAKYYYFETTLESDMFWQYMKQYHSDCVVLSPDKTYEEIVKEKKYMPTTYNRFCCKERRKSVAAKKMTEEATHMVLGNRREEGIYMPYRYDTPTTKTINDIIYISTIQLDYRKRYRIY